MTLKEQILTHSASVWRALPAQVRYGVLHATQASFLVGVVGVIFDARGRVLVLEHRFRVPWRWGLPGGFLSRGETMVEGLERELREETELVIRATPEIIDVEHQPDLGFVSFCLTGRYVSGQARLSDEILSASFVEPDHLPEGTYPYHSALIRQVLSRR